MEEQNNPYKRELATDMAAKKKVIIELSLKTAYLTSKDIGEWRQAWQMAINVENPRRGRLLDIYTDIEVDNHLFAAIRNRKSSVLQKNFRIVDTKSGKEDKELSELLESVWFKQWMELALETIYKGPSLGEFVNPGILTFSDVIEVPRKHVIPEYSVFVKNESDDIRKGIKYAEKPYIDWITPIIYKSPRDLGLLHKVAPHAIAKKHVMAFWDNFAELFGMPIRIGTTNSRDGRDRSAIENMLEGMGASSWGLFPEGTDIKLVETSRGDAFEVYDSRIERANSEMSKAIIGQTMTMDDGSSRSQSEVHKDQFEKIIFADADWLKDQVNSRLFPFLMRHGFKLQNRRFEWDESTEYTPEEQMKIEEMILNNYDIDPKYFVEKYNIPILGVKKQPSLSLEKKKHNSIIDQLSSLYTCNCELFGGYKDSEIQLAAVNDEEMMQRAAEVAMMLYNGTFQGQIDPVLVKMVLKELLKAIATGIGKNIDDVAYTSVDFQMIQSLKKQVFQFSAAKNYNHLRELSNLIVDDKGLVKPFATFMKDASELNLTFNKTHMATERQLAIMGSKNAGRWAMFSDDSLLEYRTVGDNNVRDAHRQLHGIIKPKSSDFWNTYYPPNGYRCRCIAIEKSNNAKETPDDKINTPEIPEMFKTNLAKKGLVFPPDHPYFTNTPSDIIDQANDILQ